MGKHPCKASARFAHRKVTPQHSSITASAVTESRDCSCPEPYPKVTPTPPSSLTQGSLTWQGGHSGPKPQRELSTPVGPSERWCGRACCSCACTSDGSQPRPRSPNSPLCPFRLAAAAKPWYQAWGLTPLSPQAQAHVLQKSFGDIPPRSFDPLSLP